jgi:hypothetical protein
MKLHLFLLPIPVATKLLNIAIDVEGFVLYILSFKVDSFGFFFLHIKIVFLPAEFM